MPAHSATLGSISVAGTPVAFSQQPTTRLVSNTRYQLSASAHRRLDPAAALTVEVDADGAGAGTYVTVNPDDYAVDYLFGIIDFKTDQGANATVRISGRFLPVLPVALVRSLSLSVANDVTELNVLGDGYKRRAVTLKDFSGELNGLDLATTDLDGGAGTTTLQTYVDSGAPLFIEVGKGAGTQVFRAWVKVPELAHKLSTGSLYEHTLKFQGHAFTGSGQTEYVAWGYGAP